MEVKSTVWATVAVVITAFGAITIYAIEREVSKNELTKARQELASQASLLETRKRSRGERETALSAVQERVAEIRATRESIAAAETHHREIMTKIEGLRADWTRTRSDFGRDVEQVRQRIRDEVMPALTLEDGSSLKSVRFKEMKETTVILEHSAGIAKVPLSNMPALWVGRLALGWNPKLPAELSGKPDEPEPVVKVTAPDKTFEIVQQEHRESVKRGDVKDAESKIRNLERRIVEAERSQEAKMRIADEYQAKYLSAINKGNSSNHGVKRDEALRAVESLGKQITAAHAQIQKLRREIIDKSE